MAAVILATLVPTAATASATAASSDIDTAIANLTKSGTLSPEDRAAILKDPSLAAQVIDPDSLETGSEEVDLSKLPVTNTACGAWRDAWYRYRTVLGNTAYKFHQYMQWCYNGRQVTSIQSRYPYISEADGFEYYRGLIANSKGPVPAGEVYSFIQGHMENCIAKYGCISSTYPWVKIWAGNNGSSKWDAGR